MFLRVCLRGAMLPWLDSWGSSGHNRIKSAWSSTFASSSKCVILTYLHEQDEVSCLRLRFLIHCRLFVGSEGYLFLRAWAMVDRFRSPHRRQAAVNVSSLPGQGTTIELRITAC